MIAHCPACGTHYRHDVLATPMRGRCGRCDAAIDLSRLRPYRLVAPREAAAVALAASASPSPIVRIPAPVAPALEPAVVAAPLQAAAPALDGTSWENEDPLPPIPEMEMQEIELRPIAAVDREGTRSSEATDVSAGAAVIAAPTGAEGRGTTWLLWVAAGAIAGTGISWTIGGTTLTGVIAGTLAGAIAGWGWLRWMSAR